MVPGSNPGPHTREKELFYQQTNKNRESMTQKELNQQVRAWQKEDEKHRAVLAIMVETEERGEDTDCTVIAAIGGNKRVLIGVVGDLVRNDACVGTIVGMAIAGTIKAGDRIEKNIEDEDQDEDQDEEE